jgi:hypothetical protein
MGLDHERKEERKKKQARSKVGKSDVKKKISQLDYRLFVSWRQSGTNHKLLRTP